MTMQYDPVSGTYYDDGTTDTSSGGSMIDLNDPSTYSIQDYGGGNILYTDTSTGLSYDPSDLSTPLSATQVQSYGAAVNTSGAISSTAGQASTQSSYHAPSPAPTANSASQGGLSTAGLSGMFTAIGSAFASVLNPPKTTTTGGPLVYDAVRGTYVPASAAGQSVTSLSNIPMWLILGIVAVVVGIAFIKEEK